jgi:hypothetical protein
MWENTFWNDANETIPQLDGTDDVLDMPRCKRLGVRGKSFVQKPVPKPSAENCISAVVKSDVSLLASNGEMFCNVVTELKTKEVYLSSSPEKETCVKQITVEGRNAVIAGGMETQHEDGEAPVSQESLEAALQTGPVTADDSVIDTKRDDCIDMKTDVEIRPVESCSLLIVARNVNGPVDAGNMRSLLEDCPSSVTCVSHENGIETESAIDQKSLIAVPEDCVELAISAVTKSESLKILSEPLVEVSDALSRVSQDSGVQVMGYLGSEPAALIDKQTNNGHAVNAKICITGKKSASENGKELVVGERVDSVAVSTQTRNILGEFLQPSSNTPTVTASQVCVMTISDDKCTGFSHGRYLKKLARELRRRKSKKLSLSYRRKAASLMSGERNKRVRDSTV